MANLGYILVFSFLFVGQSYSQIQTPGSVMTAMLNKQSLRKFARFCQQGNEPYYSGTATMTVFAPNNTAFESMPGNRQSMFNSLSQEQMKDFCETLTVSNRLTIDNLRQGDEMKSFNGKTLFFAKENLQSGFTGGVTGRTATFVNGAEISGEQITTSNGIIHIINRVPEFTSTKSVYGYISRPDDSSLQTVMFQEIMNRLYGNYYDESIAPIATNQHITFFLPSEDALRKIPAQKLAGLNGQKLSDYFRMHYIPSQVVFTSYVQNNRMFPSGFPQSNIIFRRFEEKVFVISGGVTAQVTRGNITVANGVIHIVDKLFGFVYNTAREQIQADASYFGNLINLVPVDLQNKISQQNANIFVPSNEAFAFAERLPWIDFNQNRTLLDMVVRLCLLRDGSVEVSAINGDYNVRERKKSDYNDFTLVVYNDRNDTWVNGGNVRARIIRPDIKVQVGRLQYIDGIPGVPTKDIDTLVFYDDWLLRTHYDLNYIGLDEYLRDPRYDRSILPARSYNGMSISSASSQYPTQYPGQYTTQYPNSGQQYPNSGQQYPNSGQQYPNSGQQYPNSGQQYPNSGQQYPNSGQQYPSNGQYPNGQNSGQYPNTGSSTGKQTYQSCGDIYNVCHFTFFCPNGSAIDAYYRLGNYGTTIVRDPARYRFVLRRLIIPHQQISIEQLPVSQRSYSYRTDSGETITIQKETQNTARIRWKSESARIIMWDLGATNGIVHMIDNVLSDYGDLSIRIDGAPDILTRNLTLHVLLCILVSLYFSRKQD